MLLRTRITAVVATAACALIATLALLLGAWESAQRAGTDRLRLEVQHALWQQIKAARLERLRTKAAALATDPVIQNAMERRDLDTLRPALRERAGGTDIDLFDAGGRLLYTSSTDVSAEMRLDMAGIRQVLGGDGNLAGLAPAAGQRFVLIVAAPVLDGGRIVGGIALSEDVGAALRETGAYLQTRVALLNLRGLAVAGDGASLLNRLGIDAPVHRDDVASADEGARRYAVTSTPVSGYDARQAAVLAAVDDVTAARNRERRLLAAFAGIAAACIVGTSVLVYAQLRASFAPLARAVDVLTALADGDTSVRVDAGRMDEAGQIAAGVSRLRDQMLNLETLRDELRRGRQQQQRIIRGELRALAATLGESEPADILSELESTAAASHPDTHDADNSQLASLALVLGQLGRRIRDQHARQRQLIDELNQALAAKQAFAALRQELEIARRMQSSVLPRHFPPRSDVSLASFMLPAREVGGDFYDYFLLDDDRLAVVIADVSGKGVPAAFFMAISRTLLKVSARFVQSPAETLARVNDLLAAENEETMFVTVFYGVLELRNGRFTYANGGHNPPALLTRTGEWRFLPRTLGMALGVAPGAAFAEGDVRLGPGEMLFLYTDGVTEALNPRDELFGDAALLETLRRMPAGASVDAYAPAVMQTLQAFAGDAPQADDITCVSVRYAGAAVHRPHNRST